MSFTVTLEGLTQLKQDLSTDNFDKATIKAIGVATKQLHGILTEAVKRNYNTGSKSLNTVLVGGTTSSLKRGAGFIEMGLTYQSKNIPLTEFPISIGFSPEITSFVAPNIFTPLLRGKIQRVKPVEVVSVGIRKEKLTLIKGGFRGKVRGKQRILRRGNYFIGGKTWDKLPTKDDLVGERKVYFELKGVSLSEMAGRMYDIDPFAKRFKQDFSSLIADNLIL
jgi:hypothetical protein